jgi:molybdopterin molybdotransferase
VTDLLSLEDALGAVLSRARPLPTEQVPIEDAGGRVLAEPARASIDLPPFPSSAMDGYALRAADTPARLPVTLRVAAGRPAPRPLEPGEAMAIATGGVVPDGADSVIPHEDVVEEGDSIVVGAPVQQGANVRPRAGDTAAGEVVVEAGTRLRPGHVGALAAAGIAEVVCARRPRAAVLTTGSELRAPGQPLATGEIYESNGAMLAVQLAAAGAVVERLGSIADEEAAHRSAIERGLEADVLVTSGGVSVGPHDLVRRAQAELGVEQVFWRVSLKPGKPVSFGVRNRTLVFGLPGNPVSSLVGCELFVKPALLALQGALETGPPLEEGRLEEAVRRDERRTELVRARLRPGAGTMLVQALSGRESHMIVRAAAADALVIVPPGEGELPAGAAVRYLRLGVS